MTQIKQNTSETLHNLANYLNKSTTMVDYRVGAPYTQADNLNGFWSVWYKDKETLKQGGVRVFIKDNKWNVGMLRKNIKFQISQAHPVQSSFKSIEIV